MEMKRYLLWFRNLKEMTTKLSPTVRVESVVREDGSSHVRGWYVIAVTTHWDQERHIKTLSGHLKSEGEAVYGPR